MTSFKKKEVKCDIHYRYLGKQQQQTCSHHEREVAQVGGSVCGVFAFHSPCPPWLLMHFGAWRTAPGWWWDQGRGENQE